MAATTAKPIVELAGASLLVGGRLLFRCTNWAIRPGEHWALIGPNGSGKTLFASALTGAVPVVCGELRAPDGGVIHVSFEQQKALAGDAPAAARWFSLEEEEAPPVHQFLSQDSVEERNPFEIVARSRAAARAFAARRRHVVNLLGIASLLDQPLPSLSNGEMRKLLLARALLRQPRLLILDDPFAALDESFRRHVKAILEKLVRRGTVHLLLIATHPDELPRGITHLLRVDHCRVVGQGRFVPHRARELFRATGRKSARRLSVDRKRSDAEELVRLTGVTVRYGKRVIVENINWTIRRGESWALLGPNGSGKSTLLSLIIGDNPQAYANDVRVFGHRRGDGESVWALKRRIGSVSPELHLHFPESETCLDAVASGFADTYGCFRRPSSRQRAAARRLLARFGLASRANQSFGSLSAGWQRMTLLARALVKSPKLLVLDEPCQGLDAAHRARIIRTVEGLLRHTTVIYVTHRRDEIPSGIHRVLRLS
ncbi:MAG TPA: ATP-binding cassette domain-containing protein [Verrucomicrobiae bacterium]|nr:ATP-binding cassette domain-containing protein [Verrucomicrobiae bacterium]